MKFRIVAVGKIKERATRSLVDEYLGRLKRYCAVEEIELEPSTPAKEAAAFAKATEGAHVIALDAAGKALDSRRFARGLEHWASRGKGQIAFLIGGAEGLPSEVRRTAQATWSLSPLTFPHRLARLVLAEQLYRGMTILRGEPYDK
ncbi:MAG TPA: 23S rRNA (pseudouridine(1915)-N(3))-methyltransferase RlmH [Polyangiaceae bacterium]|nr:23S rRNA (pseudouridine(1915)-N(3))-methyltransferase RlmH [Polyangiaceae bacterium]